MSNPLNTNPGVVVFRAGALLLFAALLARLALRGPHRFAAKATAFSSPQGFTTVGIVSPAAPQAEGTRIISDVGNQSTLFSPKNTSRHDPHMALQAYIAAYNRSPPEGFEAWVDFAEARHCALDPEAYSGLERDLALHRERPPTHESVRAAFQKLDNVVLLSLHKGEVSGTFGKGLAGADIFSTWPVDYYAYKIKEFASLVPDFEILLNILDEPRVWWPEPLPSRLQRQLDRGTITPVQAFREHGCHATESLSRWHVLHAYAIAPRQDRPIIHQLAPVLSFSSIPRCFADIMVPHQHAEIHHGKCAPSCPQNAIPWDEKVRLN